MHKEKEIKPKILFQALALDLLWACLPERPRPLLRPVEWLIIEALGLPPWHEAGHWHAEGLETRGRPEREALATAIIIQGRYEREYNKPMPLHTLEKEMKLEGFKYTWPVHAPCTRWRARVSRKPLVEALDTIPLQTVEIIAHRMKAIELRGIGYHRAHQFLAWLEMKMLLDL
jgi:hypothetical protein